MTDTLSLCQKCARNDQTAIQWEGIGKVCDIQGKDCEIYSYSTYQKQGDKYVLHHMFYQV